MHNYEKLISKIRNNEIVLWVGTGFPKYSGVPMEGKLVEIIKQEAVDYEKKILKNINLLPDVAEEFVKRRNNTKTDLISILKKALLFDIDSKELFVHNSLKNIPQIDTIITTNFDNIFEQIYRNDIEVIIKDESISTAFLAVNKDKVKMLKIHFDFTNPELMNQC